MKCLNKGQTLSTSLRKTLRWHLNLSAAPGLATVMASIAISPAHASSKWALPTALTRAVADRENRRWRRYHIRTSKPVMRPDEGVSLSCFARDILTTRDPVTELCETTRRSLQKDSGGTHVWWRQEPPLVAYPHTPGGIAAPQRSVHQSGSHPPTHGRSA